MAQLEWVDLRLKNWALWVRGGRTGGLGYAAANVLAAAGGGGGSSSGYRESIVPIDAPEASATDQAIQSLEPELQQVVREVYLEPGPSATIAAQLGIAERTLRDRLGRAHHCIARWFTERKESQAAERARLERIGREAAMKGTTWR